MSRRSTAQILAARQASRQAFGDALWAATHAVLANEDPLGLLACGAPSDAYEGEVEALLPKLSGCTSAAETCTAIFEVFERQFGRERVRPSATPWRPADLVAVAGPRLAPLAPKSGGGS